MDDFPELTAWVEECGHTVSIVGAGGKTTLMYRLAQAFADQGDTCILTTTTHILRPADLPVTDNPLVLHALLSAHPVVVYAAPAEEDRLGPPPDMQIGHLADWLLVEADGSRQLPCKVPAEHEPRILPGTQVVLGVIGLRALNQPLRDVCFRLDHAKPLLQTDSDAVVTPEDMVHILLSAQGTRKGSGTLPYGIVLSQCEANETGAQEVRELLHAQGFSPVFCLRHP